MSKHHKTRKIKHTSNTHCRSTIESPPASELLWTVWPAAEFPVLESIQAELEAHVLGILEKGCLCRVQGCTGKTVFESPLLEHSSNLLTQKMYLLHESLGSSRVSGVAGSRSRQDVIGNLPFSVA